MAFYHFSKLQTKYPIVRVLAQQPSFTQGHSIVSSPSKLVSDSKASLFPSESTLKKPFPFASLTLTSMEKTRISLMRPRRYGVVFVCVRERGRGARMLGRRRHGAAIRLLLRRRRKGVI
ncbi:uncharacterized protein LOC108483933 [Gossypium arboreum]|uniref:uncharacterized protein LOC108483933 n=1 Tax=Gossypium arboreum TaxID=29729 RepID=UPI0022F15B12|nr:uncharacterized protein LOC108483933 [Gossypium arboreum]